MTSSDLKQSGGVLARNPRQGFRSETLARYALSAFGPATDIEVEDDQGFDLLCATARPVGQRLHVGPSYYVQVKSSGTDQVMYTGGHVFHWLEGLGMPLFICVVDKEQTRVRLYSTWSIARILLQRQAHGLPTDSISLVMNAEVTSDQPSPDRVTLGPPVVDFLLRDLADHQHLAKLRICIEEWVTVDSENIVRRRMGLAIAKGYIKWETNRPPSESAHWYKPYYYSPPTAEKAREILAECASLLALQASPDERGALAEAVLKCCAGVGIHPMQREWLGLGQDLPATEN